MGTDELMVLVPGKGEIFNTDLSARDWHLVTHPQLECGAKAAEGDPWYLLISTQGAQTLRVSGHAGWVVPAW